MHYKYYYYYLFIIGGVSKTKVITPRLDQCRFGFEFILYFSVFLCSNIMNNKVFYQHPNLMRALGMHETVMEVMVNVLGEGESKVRDDTPPHNTPLLQSASPRGFLNRLFSPMTPSSGDNVSQDGGALLPVPVLLLSYQPTESGLHV